MEHCKICGSFASERGWCTKCQGEQDPEKSPEERREQVRRSKQRSALRKYGLNPEKYNQLYDRQGGRCALCQRQQAVLCIDHDHKRGTVRALLCHPCNRILGFIESERLDLGEWSERAADYLGH